MLVEELASRGYVVVTIDHTYETIVELPGGRVTQPVDLPPTPASLQVTMVGDRRLDAGVDLDGSMATADGSDGDPYTPGRVAAEGLDRRSC